MLCEWRQQQQQQVLFWLCDVFVCFSVHVQIFLIFFKIIVVSRVVWSVGKSIGEVSCDELNIEQVG